jgi:hypothetical protein
MARIVSIAVFFLILFASIDFGDPFNVTIGFIALAKACLAAVLLWAAGFIAGDIFFKGAVQSIESVDVPLYEGGIVQQIVDEKKRMDPDVPVKKPEKPKKEKKK